MRKRKRKRAPDDGLGQYDFHAGESRKRRGIDFFNLPFVLMDEGIPTALSFWHFDSDCLSCYENVYNIPRLAVRGDNDLVRFRWSKLGYCNVGSKGRCVRALERSSRRYRRCRLTHGAKFLSRLPLCRVVEHFVLMIDRKCG
jgi:hypothetical protein